MSPRLNGAPDSLPWPVLPIAPGRNFIANTTKPIYDEWRGIRWKGKREKFELEHERDLKAFRMARRKLEKHLSPAGKTPSQAWRQELALLQRDYQAEYEQYKPIRDDLWKLQQVKRCTDTALHQQNQTQQKYQETKR